MTDTKISEAAVEAAFQAYINHDDTVETSIRAALVAALPHLHPQPAELAQSPAGHELAYAVEKALGNRDGKRDAELDELLEMAMNELNAINTNLPAELAEQQGVWPFVESPGEFTARLREAIDNYHHSNLLGAVRYVLIENPPTLAATGKQPVGGARPCAAHCQSGRPDVCLASQRDNVTCPHDICDIDDGVRHNHLVAAKQVGEDSPSRRSDRLFNEMRKDAVQQGGEGEWVRDIHDVEQGLIQRPVAPHAANNAPSPTVRMQVGEVQGDCRSPNEMADDLERIAGGALSDYEGCEADELHILRCAKLIRDLAARPPVGQDNPLMAFADSYRRMANLGSGRVSCLSVAYDIETNMAKHAAPPAQGIDLGPGVRAIADERQRQVDAEGYSAASDADYKAGELANAALAYVQVAAMDLAAGGRSHVATRTPPACWPWHRLWWKPKDARRDLVRAGALIAAQIDLIDGQRDAAPGAGS